MRFSVAWASVISENQILKMALGCFIVAILGMSTVIVKLSGRKPLIIERACYSRSVPAADGERTQAEVEAFVGIVLTLRFDTEGIPKPTYLSLEEEKFRTQEQQEFKKRGIIQKIIVNKVSSEGEKVAVDADRILTMGNVRTVLAFPLAVTLGTIPRSDANPYGLALLQVSVPKLDEKSNGDKK